MKKQVLLFATVILFISTSVVAQSFTIDDILSASMPGNLTISNGDKVAWVENKEGVRNIWLAASPDFEAKMITAYELDDGQVISRLVFNADDSKLYFIRGGAPNGRGEIPNPALNTQGADRSIWEIDLSTNALKKIAEGSGHTLSPDGKTLLFVKSGEVFSYDLSVEEGKPFQLIHTRGRTSTLSFSPNGKRVALESSRGDHSFIGVFTWADSSLIYLDPTVDHDVNPVWSPDSKKLAFMRVPNEDDRLPFMPRRESLPWSIRIADIDKNETVEVWKVKEGRGSAFRFISAANQLMWTATNHIIFPYEGDGWTHLYSLDANSKNVILLTPGNFEVQFVAVSADGKNVVFSSNQDDIDRQHLWQYNIETNKLEQLTKGTGIEWSPRMNKNGSLFYLASGPTMAAHVEMIISKGGKSKNLHPEGIPDRFPDSKELVIPQQVIFRAADGLKIHGQLFVPKNLKKRVKLPAVMFFHGGSRRQMLLGFHHSGYYHNAYSLNQYLASQGFVVLSVNYRSGIGYGMEFREALNYGARGASEFNDVLGGGMYLQNRPDVDPDRIGLWGGSYGGFLTAMGLAKASDMFAAGVDIHGVHDWNIVIKNFVSSYDAGKNEAAAKLAFDSSPLAYVDTWRSPVLLIHGDDDRNVPFSESVNMVESLRRQGVEFEQLVFPDEVHGFLLHRSWIKAYKATADFFKRML